MRDLLNITKALADESRLRILAALEGRELCLCQLVEMLGLATSTVSRHATVLQQARLVEARKEGRWTYFRLADDDAPAAARHALAWVQAAMQADSRIADDARKLKLVLEIDPELLCRKQSQCRC